MAERFWEQRTSRIHTYVNETGCIIGSLSLRLTTKSFEANAYGRLVGEYLDVDAARFAVEGACVEIEEIRRIDAAKVAALAAAAKADGEPA